MSKRLRNRKKRERDRKRKNFVPDQNFAGKLFDAFFFEWVLLFGRMPKDRGSKHFTVSLFLFAIGALVWGFEHTFHSLNKNTSLTIFIVTELLLQFIWWFRYGNSEAVEALIQRRRNRHPLMFFVVWGPFITLFIYRLWQWSM
jgi:hypothetical protein